MKVGELGEFGLIDALARIAPPGDESHQILVGIGDDAAAWKADGRIVLATTDTLVEAVHFTEATPWYDLGWKAMVAGLSDVAAMGGDPRYALVALCLAERTEVNDVTQLYQGMADVAVRFGVAIVGGNISRAAAAVITVTVIGQAQEGRILTRSAARPGDLLAVTGQLGSSSAGMKVLTQRLEPAAQAISLLQSAHLRPLPRISCGQQLAALGVKAAIDISDGLIADLGHICRASGAGAVVQADQLPIHAAVKEMFPQDYLDLALSGGEDYELLFTASTDSFEEVKRSLNSEECPITVIGQITTPKDILVLRGNGQPYVTKRTGWDHFEKGE